MCFKHSANADIHIRMNIHLYEYTHIHSTSMNTFKRLSRFDIEIHKVSYSEYLAIDDDVASH
jgi:hypothetical protein